MQPGMAQLRTRPSRFVRITHHAWKSMESRQIDHDTLYKVIEEGQVKKRDDVHVWIYLNLDDRMDNLVCAAAVMADAVIVKTVMINWALEDEP